MVFNPDNVLLSDAKTGEIPAEEGTLILKEFMTNSAVAQLAQYEEMTKPKKEFTYLAEGPGAYWVAEGDRIQTSKATWLSATFEAKKLGLILPVSKEFFKYTLYASLIRSQEYFQLLIPERSTDLNCVGGQNSISKAT